MPTGGKQGGAGRLGPYRVVDEIGRGAMGAVYEAEDPGTGRRLAVKVLLKDPARKPKIAARFRREAELAAALNHPGIVTIHTVGETEGRPWIAMDLVDGRDLSAHLEETGRDPLDVARILRDVARALHHAHEHGIVHRDIKPQNILIDPDGRPHLTDFGLAKGVDSSELTRTGSTLGTPAYMSPEQAEGGARDVDARSDVFALGVVLWEALTDRRPFEADSFFALAEAIRSADAPPPSDSTDLGSVGPSFDAICERALARSPDDRYPTAEALAEDLDRVLRGSRVEPRAPSRSVSPGLLAGGGVGVVLLALLVWASWPGGPPGDPSGAEAGAEGVDADLARLAEDPGNRSLRRSVARSLFSRGRLDEADRVLAAAPGAPGPDDRRLQARIALYEGRPEAVIRHLEGLDGSALSVDDLLARAEARARTGDAAGAGSDVDLVATRLPRGDLRPAAAEVAVRLRREDRSGALLAACQAIPAPPPLGDDPPPGLGLCLARRAETLLSLGRAPFALEDADRAVRAEGGPRARVLRAVCRLLDGDPEGAADDARSVLQGEGPVRAGVRDRARSVLVATGEEDIDAPDGPRARLAGRLGDRARLHRRVAEVAEDPARVLDRARPLLRAALRLVPGDPVASGELGTVLLLETGDGDGARTDLERARRLLRRAVDALPDEVDYLRRLGEAAGRLGASDEALEALLEASRRAPDDPTIARLRAEALLRADRSRSAGSVLADALEAHPRDPALLELAAEVQESRGRSEAATVLRERASEETPEARSRRAREILREARGHARRGDADAAAHLAARAARTAPRDLEALRLAGHYQWRSDESSHFDAVLHHASQVILNPDYVPYVLEDIHDILRLANVDRLVRRAEEGLVERPDDPRLRVVRSLSIYWDAFEAPGRRMLQFWRDLEEVARRRPASVLSPVLLGSLALRYGWPATGTRFLDEARTLDEEGFAADFFEGVALALIGETGRALEALERAVIEGNMRRHAELLPVFPGLADLRGIPRFDRLQEHMEARVPHTSDRPGHH